MEKIEELKKLKDLFDEGLISNIEFNELKKNIINKSNSNPINGSDIKYVNQDKSDIQIDSSIKLRDIDKIDLIEKSNYSNFKTYTIIVLLLMICVLVWYNFLNHKERELNITTDKSIVKISKSASVHATTKPIEKDVNSQFIDTIAKESNGEEIETDMERNIKSGEQYKIVDKNLNEVYKKVMSVLSEDEKTALKFEQRKWIKYRDSKCDEETTEDKSSSMYPAFLNSCLMDKTNVRIKELNDILNQKKN